MDELGRVIANLMNSLPENQSGAEASAPPAAPFAGDADAGDSQDGLSLAEGGEEGNPLSFLSGPGGGDLMGMLGAFFLFGLLYWKNSEIRFLRQDYFHPLINEHTAHPLLQ